MSVAPHWDWEYFSCRHRLCSTEHTPEPGKRYDPATCPTCKVASVLLNVWHQDPPAPIEQWRYPTMPPARPIKVAG